MPDFSKMVKEAVAAAKGIRAYHGSPYKFDRFDLSKTGTGEGGAAFGHGLYFAENPAVAQTYKNMSRTTDMNWPVVGGKPGMEVPAWVARAAQVSPTGLDEVTTNFAQRVKDMTAEKHWNLEGIRDIHNALKDYKAGKVTFEKPGAMYEVNIRAQPEQFLDWDKPIAPQNAYRALRQHWDRTVGDPDIVAQRMGITPDAPGGRLYSGIGGLTQNQEASSRMLREAGVPGLRYLDQGSRGGAGTSRNYLLFRDDIIDILKRYGIAAPTAGVVADQLRYLNPQMNPQEAQ